MTRHRAPPRGAQAAGRVREDRREAHGDPGCRARGLRRVRLPLRVAARRRRAGRHERGRPAAPLPEQGDAARGGARPARPALARRSSPSTARTARRPPRTGRPRALQRVGTRRGRALLRRSPPRPPRPTIRPTTTSSAATSSPAEPAQRVRAARPRRPARARGRPEARRGRDDRAHGRPPGAVAARPRQRRHGRRAPNPPARDRRHRRRARRRSRPGAVEEPAAEPDASSE